MPIKKITSFLKQNNVQVQSDSIETHQFKDANTSYDVVIHIGAPKTGSSAIQKFFFENRQTLLELGYMYPAHALDKNGISGGHSLLAIALMEKRYDDANDIFNDWYQHAKNLAKTLLISSESFFNIPQQLETFLEDRKVLVISYYRLPMEYVVSVHNQLIKRHYETSTVSQYVNKLLTLENGTANLINKPWEKTYQQWEKLVGKDNLVVRSYEKKTFFKNKIELDIINRLGVDTKFFSTESRRINSSYTLDALEIKRQINYVLSKTNPLNHRIDLRLQNYSDERNSKRIISAQSLDLQLVEKLRRHFKKTEELIVKNYLENPYNKSLSTIKKNPYQIKNRHISTSKVFKFLLSDNEIKEYLRKQTILKLESGHVNYSIIKLAEALKIENIEEFEPQDFWFTSKQLIAMTKYQAADFLRDMAGLLLIRNDLTNSEILISKAFELRPKGLAIIKLKQDIKNKIDGIE